jgi:hypothetical protein
MEIVMKDLESLLNEVEEISKEIASHHYTIFRFSSHFKGAFGTPDRLRLELPHLPCFGTLRELLIWMIGEQVNFWDIETENIEGFRIHNGVYYKEEDFTNDI